MGIFGDIFQSAGKPNAKFGRKTVYPTGKMPGSTQTVAPSTLTDTEGEPVTVARRPRIPQVCTDAQWESIITQTRSEECRSKLARMHKDLFDAAQGHEVPKIPSVMASVEQEMFELAQALKNGDITLLTEAEVQRTVDYIDRHHGALGILGNSYEAVGRYTKAEVNFGAYFAGFGEFGLSVKQADGTESNKHPTWKAYGSGTNLASSRQRKLSAAQIAEVQRVMYEALDNTPGWHEFLKAVQQTVGCLHDTQGDDSLDKRNIRGELGRYYSLKLGTSVVVFNAAGFVRASRLPIALSSEYSFVIPVAVPVYLVGTSGYSVPAVINPRLWFNAKGTLSDAGPIRIRVCHCKDAFKNGRLYGSGDYQQTQEEQMDKSLTRTELDLYVVKMLGM